MALLHLALGTCQPSVSNVAGSGGWLLGMSVYSRPDAMLIFMSDMGASGKWVSYASVKVNASFSFHISWTLNTLTRVFKTNTVLSDEAFALHGATTSATRCWLNGENQNFAELHLRRNYLSLYISKGGTHFFFSWMNATAKHPKITSPTFLDPGLQTVLPVA